MSDYYKKICDNLKSENLCKPNWNWPGFKYPKLEMIIPIPGTNQFQTVPVITLRDWYAGMALQGLLSHGIQRAELGTPALAEWYVEKAYQIADAMMMRKKKEKNDR